MWLGSAGGGLRHSARNDRRRVEELVTRLQDAGCIYAEEEVELLLEAAAGDDERLDALTQRRVDGEPLEHVVGWAQFDGHRYIVHPGVFVPRPRTESLVLAAHEYVEARDTITLLDLCCGTAALGLAVRRRFSGTVELHAADVEPAAVACARENVGDHGTVHTGDLFDALPAELRGRFDLVIANVPYVPTEHIQYMNSEARDHEPASALDGGADGLDILRRVVSAAPDWLAPGGFVISEVTEAQAPAALDAITTAGLAALTRVDRHADATFVLGVR